MSKSIIWIKYSKALGIIRKVVENSSFKIGIEINTSFGILFFDCYYEDIIFAYFTPNEKSFSLTYCKFSLGPTKIIEVQKEIHSLLKNSRFRYRKKSSFNSKFYIDYLEK